MKVKSILCFAIGLCISYLIHGLWLDDMLAIAFLISFYGSIITYELMKIKEEK